MSESINDGGQAFPGSGIIGSFSGMSLRDYFAAAALQSVSCGIIADANFGTTSQSLAATAYDIAAAMLAAREGK